MTTTMNQHYPNQPEDDHPDLLTIAEVARALRWNATTVHRHINSGVIPDTAIVRLPHTGTRTSYRVKRAWLDRVLEGKRTNAGPARPVPASP